MTYFKYLLVLEKGRKIMKLGALPGVNMPNKSSKMCKTNETREIIRAPVDGPMRNRKYFA